MACRVRQGMQCLRVRQGRSLKRGRHEQRRAALLDLGFATPIVTDGRYLEIDVAIAQADAEMAPGLIDQVEAAAEYFAIDVAGIERQPIHSHAQ